MDEKSTVNDPYFGGYVTRHFVPFTSVPNVQIEINRAEYMDEKIQQLIPSKSESFSKRLNLFFQELSFMTLD